MKNKKIISLVLSIVLALGIFTPCTKADETTDMYNAYYSYAYERALMDTIYFLSEDESFILEYLYQMTQNDLKYLFCDLTGDGKAEMVVFAEGCISIYTYNDEVKLLTQLVSGVHALYASIAYYKGEYYALVDNGSSSSGFLSVLAKINPQDGSLVKKFSSKTVMDYLGNTDTYYLVNGNRVSQNDYMMYNTSVSNADLVLDSKAFCGLWELGAKYGFYPVIDYYCHDENLITVTVNGNKIENSSLAQLINGRTMVPIRSIAESLGADVIWYGDTEEVGIKKGNDTVMMKIGSNRISINEKVQTMDVAPIIVDSTTLVPVRFVSEALHANVAWSDVCGKYVTISTSKITPEQAVELVKQSDYEFGFYDVVLEDVRRDNPDYYHVTTYWRNPHDHTYYHDDAGASVAGVHCETGEIIGIAG